MHMPLTPQMPESFFPSAAAANVPHDVVHNKFMALLHLQEGTCPFRRMVCTGVYTIFLFVLFGRWSAQAFTQFSFLSFSARVCTGVYPCPPRVLFGGWSAQAFTQFSYLSFSADGLHRRLHMSHTCPFRRMVCTGVYAVFLLVLFGGWSAQACVYTIFLIVLFGGWSTQAITLLSNLSFSCFQAGHIS